MDGVRVTVDEFHFAAVGHGHGDFSARWTDPDEQFQFNLCEQSRVAASSSGGDQFSGGGRGYGTTWSVYFKDPEGNGLEVFCDTPWHVDQPQGVEWDPTLADDELLRWTENRFKDEPGFVRR